MPEFIVHQHHHYGWTTNVREAETPELAAYQDMLAYHDFLTEEGATKYTYEVKARYGRLDVVVFAAEFHRIFNGCLKPGDYWFTAKCRIGEADDCQKCGGTGGNHYTDGVTQCWACGDGKSKGKSSGKKVVAGGLATLIEQREATGR